VLRLPGAKRSASLRPNRGGWPHLAIPFCPAISGRWPRKEVLGHTAHELRIREDPQDRAFMIAQLQRGPAGPARNAITWFRTKSGRNQDQLLFLRQSPVWRSALRPCNLARRTEEYWAAALSDLRTSSETGGRSGSRLPSSVSAGLSRFVTVLSGNPTARKISHHPEIEVRHDDAYRFRLHFVLKR
jgi:hypothetical protein